MRRIVEEAKEEDEEFEDTVFIGCDNHPVYRSRSNSGSDQFEVAENMSRMERALVHWNVTGLRTHAKLQRRLLRRCKRCRGRLLYPECFFEHCSIVAMQVVGKKFDVKGFEDHVGCLRSSTQNFLSLLSDGKCTLDWK